MATRAMIQPIRSRGGRMNWPPWSITTVILTLPPAVLDRADRVMVRVSRGRRDCARPFWRSATMENATDPGQKALRLNLDAKTYGTFAEIGAGQEVARWFFSVGGAAGTVAKTISAYDIAVSDALYGSTPRYVSRQRLAAKLEHEFVKLHSGMGPVRVDE